MKLPEIKSMSGLIADVCARANAELGYEALDAKNIAMPVANEEEPLGHMLLSFAVFKEQLVLHYALVPTFVGQLEASGVNTETSQRGVKQVRKQLKKLARN